MAILKYPFLAEKKGRTYSKITYTDATEIDPAIIPCIIPSIINGLLINPLVAPTSFIARISSRFA